MAYHLPGSASRKWTDLKECCLIPANLICLGCLLKNQYSRQLLPVFTARLNSLICKKMIAQRWSLPLVPQPETRSIPWGDGEVIIPAETKLSISGQHYFLERGWLWGYNQKDEPVTIQRGEFEIRLNNGAFALEDVPGMPGWFYMLEGNGTIQNQDGSLILPIGEGQMIALDEIDQSSVVPYEPVVLTTLRSNEISPLTAKIEPTFKAQLTNRLAMFGINFATFVTYITYIIILLSIIILPIIAFVRWQRLQKPTIN